ncbi:MAG TPA: protein kinase [Gammaproteobacteria bacterium]|jgi:serine/threonine protein kinase|nr:protein kinase [Gammaproteobacteria bacterium]
MFQSKPVIDPVNMTEDESRQLGRLLLLIHEVNGDVYFPAGKSVHWVDGDDDFERHEINLKYPVIIRTSRHNPQQLRLEVIGNVVGAGAFSYVYDILATLVPQTDGSLEKKVKQRIVKFQIEKKHTYEVVDNEHMHAAAVPHLHIKRPVYLDYEGKSASFLVGRKMPGKSLEYLVKLRDTIILSLDERLRLSIELIHALQEQVHANLIVHRDVKPANIFVNLITGKKSQAFYIDFGLSKSKYEYDKQMAGTPLYLAPEVWKGVNATPQSDIYALGVALSLVWGASALKKANVENSLNRQFPGLFTGMTALDPGRRNRIKQIISKMCANDPAERGTLQEAEAAFDALRYEIMFSAVDVRKQNLLKQVHDAAYHLRNDLKNYYLHESDKWNINTIRREITKVMWKFPDDAELITEFVNTFGMSTLGGLTDRESINNKMKELTSEYIFMKDDLRTAYKSLDQLVQGGVPEFDGIYQAYLTSLLHNVSRRLDIKPATVDDLPELSKKFSKDIARIQLEIDLILRVKNKLAPAQHYVRRLPQASLPASAGGLFAVKKAAAMETKAESQWEIPTESIVSQFYDNNIPTIRKK